MRLHLTVNQVFVYATLYNEEVNQYGDTSDMQRKSAQPFQKVICQYVTTAIKMSTTQ